MSWLRENWFWVLVGGLFLWTHLKMHTGHGHGGHRGCGGGRADAAWRDSEESKEAEHAQH